MDDPLALYFLVTDRGRTFCNIYARAVILIISLGHGWPKAGRIFERVQNSLETDDDT